MCNFGFIYYENNVTWQPVCRICRENCSECPPGYYILKGTCVNVCPIGTSRNNGTHCLDDLTPIVYVLNKTN